MPVKKKSNHQKAPGHGMSLKQKKRRKPISEDYMIPVEPITDNQKRFFDEWDAGKMIYAYGVAGTGKTFIALYKALRDVLGETTPYEKIYIVRSLVATREIGFCLATMKTNHYCIRYHIKIWYRQCLKCLMTIHTKCCMIILRHKKRYHSGLQVSFVEQH